MTQVPRGFTLIELMIVVAVIGILAAVAIPRYEDYISRSKWAVAVAETSSIRTAIAECLQANLGNATVCTNAAQLGLASLPTTLSNAIALGAITGTGNGPTGSIVTISLGGDSAPSGCTVNIIGSSDFTSVRWQLYGSGAICTKARSGFAQS